MGGSMWSVKKNPTPARQQHLALKPLRAPDAQVDRKPDGSATLKLPLKGTWPFRPPPGATRAFELDEMGMLVWDSCDGRTALLDVIRKIADQYSLNLREAEVATLKFLQTLSRKK